jgi:hypothetical protein
LGGGQLLLPPLSSLFLLPPSFLLPPLHLCMEFVGGLGGGAWMEFVGVGGLLPPRWIRPGAALHVQEHQRDASSTPIYFPDNQAQLSTPRAALALASASRTMTTTTSSVSSLSSGHNQKRSLRWE